MWNGLPVAPNQVVQLPQRKQGRWTHFGSKGRLSPWRFDLNSAAVWIRRFSRIAFASQGEVSWLLSRSPAVAIRPKSNIRKVIKA
jgi:hypothetical protein